jgi:Fe-S cluster assembly ATP-binding protein
MSELVITGLRGGIPGREIVTGLDLTVRSGEVHAIMGPNGTGKSTLSNLIMGRPGYEVTAGSVFLDGVDMLALEPWQRASAGLFLAMQYPTEVPGVSVQSVLTEALSARDASTENLTRTLAAEAQRIGFADAFLSRSLNVDFSGGEKKRNETMQLAVLRPKFAILDELDSGLDVDALDACAKRIEQATTEWGLGVLVITHYNRLLNELKPDVVHVFAKGRIARSGGPELAEELERTGYAEYTAAEAEVSIGGLGRSRKHAPSVE